MDKEGTILREISPSAKLVCGIIARRRSLVEAQSVLEGAFGEIDSRSDIADFDFTDYYEEEMGKELVRMWISFYGRASQPEIVRAKLKAIGLERDLCDESGRRTANLDPGYVTGSKLVLASTKNFSHRVYLWGGIFAEVTLVFEHGSFTPLKWTYPDYRTNLAIDYFNRVRAAFLKAEGEPI